MSIVGWCAMVIFLKYWSSICIHPAIREQLLLSIFVDMTMGRWVPIFFFTFFQEASCDGIRICFSPLNNLSTPTSLMMTSGIIDTGAWCCDLIVESALKTTSFNLSPVWRDHSVSPKSVIKRDSYCKAEFY